MKIKIFFLERSLVRYSTSKPFPSDDCSHKPVYDVVGTRVLAPCIQHVIRMMTYKTIRLKHDKKMFIMAACTYTSCEAGCRDHGVVYTGRHEE